MNIAVTGGGGYIGSHAVQRLLGEGHRVLAIDNLMRGHARPIELLGQSAGDKLAFVRADVGERATVVKALKDHGIECVMHFAALAAVGESVEQPLLYYRNNVAAMVSLLEAVHEVGVKRFVFSSSCAVFGVPPPDRVPIDEDCPKAPISPYGMSKLHGEHLLADYSEACARSGREFAFAALRYFNVAGADRSGLLGEDHDPETHIIPVVLQAALGKRPHVGIFGTDYDTPDGTCIRDYVHVEDLIDAHTLVMKTLRPGDRRAYNVGIGKGYSVREIIESCRRVTGREIRVVEQPRRAGDPPRLFNNPAKIKSELGWSAKVTSIDEIVRSAWAWFLDHPNGYKS